MGNGCGASNYERTVIWTNLNLCSLNGVNAHGTVEYIRQKKHCVAPQEQQHEWAPWNYCKYHLSSCEVSIFLE